MRNTPSNTELEKGLQEIFPGPDAAFVARLESRLVQQAAARPQPHRGLPVSQRRGWMAAAALAGIVLVIMVVVGPRNALAAVQKLIGYVPGIGFVEDPQQPLRVLAAPVQVERDGVTLTVEKALASAGNTQVRIRVDGVPQDKSLFEHGWGEAAQPVLRASPGGDVLTATGSLSGAGEYIWAEYTFPALPASVEQVTLELNRLPGLQAGVAPENWTVDFLLPVVESGDGLVAASEETRASQPASGAQLVLESVAASEEQTALKLRLQAANPLRKADSEWWRGLVLVDDQGQTLALTHERPLNGLYDGSTVLLAPPLDANRRYTLKLDQSVFEYRFDALERIPGVRLRVPARVQPGESWPVDESLAVEGYNLHITQASLLSGQMGGYVLKLRIDPQPGLTGVGLNCRNMDVCSSSGFDLAGPGQPLTTEVYLDREPGRTIDLKAQMLMETAPGPWELSFQVNEGE